MVNDSDKVTSTFFISSTTRRGITFTEEVLQKALADYQKVIDNGRAIGYTDGFCDGYAISNLANVTHIVLAVEQVGVEYKAEIRILDTPAGKKVKDIIEQMGENTFSCNIHGLGLLNDDKVVRPGFEVRFINLCGPLT